MKRIKIQVFLLVLAVSSLVYGISLGQHRLTMEKAIRVCLECIGIG